MTPSVDPLVHRLVDEPNIAHLATVLPDGSPHSVPLWVAWEGEHLAFLTGPTSRKARNLARDARVAVSISDRERSWEMAQLRGRVVRVVDGDDGWAIIDRISQAYLGTPYPLREDRVAFLVEVEHATGESFG
ncbi:TIGR03618 family F420-dependent PPOX class oxidoreductase [Oerskovia flava]|uniref:TIGR03618 family F420-dependent PPOX class oxidoreductase n=1 Tax=Oerskovia flava TaxID=2986422 RepID=UPI00223EBBC5|nr:TIGR03618 family F420-dependent PPOX class oxidoreductase [Oerskovia sp. JB1-3-2]